MKLSDQAIILCVAADPEPEKIIAIPHRQCTIVQADADSPLPSDRFELERRVGRIAFQKHEIAIGQALDMSP